MERKICLLFAVLILSACGPTSVLDTDVYVADASVSADGSVDLTEDEEIMLGYESEVAAYQSEISMLPEWDGWMVEGKASWAKAYINGRHEHEAHVYVRYENQVLYSPAWSSEDEHFAALKYLTELQYPGWTFTFLEYEEGNQDMLVGNDVVATLGGTGISSASGHSIYLVYETIFGHEFGHTLGLHHHYCGGDPSDHCPENFPPGEGKCIMARDSVSFGPTENTFLLLTTGERPDDEIEAAIANINNRYPGQGFAPINWNDCGVEEENAP